ncbi:hypothetical protein BI004_gp029 [Bacillus phage NotTheCreek]|uniref:hypothetical protein n=1 Tax=Bacillus phage NotTheCreek TaxID=1805952 RepID=UPI0007A76B0E|nr:hypothetical protein BI004_gp029 [Bacillus phage NotTheCreek]AMW63250.1 hypothetical protein NOTTHECREEK_29 [Bacillus phage NotTheCreek]
MRKWKCAHTTLGTNNYDILKIKVSKKGKLIIAIGEEEHNNKEKVKITQKQAQELFSGMGDVLEHGRCNVIDVNDDKRIDVDFINCLGTPHYCFGIESEYDFESVHIEKLQFEQVYEQIRHFGMEGELL